MGSRPAPTELAWDLRAHRPRLAGVLPRLRRHLIEQGQGVSPGPAEERDRAGLVDASSLSPSASIEVQLRGVSIPSRYDHAPGINHSTTRSSA